jgi:putative transposase
MVWRETGIMDERLLFVCECLADERTMTDLCEEFGISRKTGYKWLGRYRELGPAGLLDLSRAPLQHGRSTAAELVARIVALKELRPTWGPKKIMKRLRDSEPQLGWQWSVAGSAGTECGVDRRPQGLVQDA